MLSASLKIPLVIGECGHSILSAACQPLSVECQSGQEFRCIVIAVFPDVLFFALRRERQVTVESPFFAVDAHLLERGAEVGGKFLPELAGRLCVAVIVVLMVISR